MDKPIYSHIIDDIERIKYLKSNITDISNLNLNKLFGSRLIYNNDKFIKLLFNYTNDCESIYIYFIHKLIQFYIQQNYSYQILIYKINYLDELALKFLSYKSNNFNVIFSCFIQLIIDNL